MLPCNTLLLAKIKLFAIFDVIIVTSVEFQRKTFLSVVEIPGMHRSTNDVRTIKSSENFGQFQTRRLYVNP